MAELLLNTIAKRLSSFRDVIKSQTEFKDELSDLDELIANIKAPLNIMVIGEFSTGKSTFINALLGQKVVKMDATPTTAVITKLCYGERDEITVYFKDNTSQVCSPAEFDALTASDGGMANEVHSRIKYVQRTLPIAYLKEATIIDSPGLEAEKTMRKEDEAITRQFMENADTILLMFDVNYMNKKTESDLLSNLSERLKPIGIVNKIDDYDEEEEDRSLEEYLDDYRRQMGDKVSELIGISAKMALDGQMKHDDDLIEESNIHVLKETIATTVIPNREKYKLNALLDRLGSLFFTFGSRLEQLDNNNKQTNNSDYEAYIEQRSRMIGILDGLGEAAVPIYEYAKEHTVYSSCKMLLGIFYRYGIVAERNIDTALQYLEASAMKNNEIAQQALAAYFYNEEIYDKAIYWYKKLNNAEALFNIGNLYVGGLGVEKNISEAIKCYKQALVNGMIKAREKLAELGDAEEQYNLSLCYKDGINIEKDEKKYLYWLEKAAKSGVEKAQYDMAMNNELSDEKKFYWCNKAAVTKEPEIHNKLGMYYEHGIGTSIDLGKAFECYKYAAEKGLAEAQYRLAKFFQAGTKSQQDNTSAFYWYKKADIQNMPEAQYEMYLCYKNGIGTIKNPTLAKKYLRKAAYNKLPEAQYELSLIIDNKKQAFELCKKAAEQKYAKAENRLGELYDKGEGVTKDEYAAFQWFRKSSRHNDPWGQYNLAECYNKGKGVVKDEYTAFNNYRKAAQNGLACAQTIVGNCFYKGIGVRKHIVSAIDWLKKAADQNQANAQYLLALIYLNDVTESNIINKEIFTLFTKAAEQGILDAKVKVALCYKNGIGVKINKEKAFHLLSELAQEGNIEAEYELGLCYENGEGTQENWRKATSYFEKLANAGLPKAQYKFSLYLKDKKEAFKLCYKAAEYGVMEAQREIGFYFSGGNVVEKNEKIALKWFLKAAEQGDAEAQNRLGLLYRKGEGVEKNSSKGVEWYKKSAENGYSWGQYNLAVCYENGYGISKNEKSAFEWYLKAARQGIPEAQNYVGVRYHDGRGTKVNYSEAFKWYRKAAEQNYGWGQYNLAYSYINGSGCEQNNNKAFFWMNKAAENGIKDAFIPLSNWYKDGIGTAVDKNKSNFWSYKAVSEGLAWKCKKCDTTNSIDATSCTGCNRTKEDALKSGCFITTAVCGSFAKADDCYELTQFRAFRDNWLVRQAGGVALVHRYYEIAPRIVAQIDKRADAKAVYLDIWQRYLKQCLHYIEIGNNEQCRKLYMQMVWDLEDRYIN